MKLSLGKTRRVQLLRKPNRRAGWAFLWGVFGIMTLFTTAFVVATLASSTRRITEVSLEQSRLRQRADAGLALAAAELQLALEEGRPPRTRGILELDAGEVAFTIAGDGPARFRLSATAQGPTTVAVRRELIAISPSAPPQGSTASAGPFHLRTLYRR